MELISSRQLKQDGAKRLEEACFAPKKLALIHTGIAMGVSLVLTLISYLLSRQMELTGGLAGIGIRTLLQSVQWILPLLMSLVMPFWEAGFVFCAMNMARGRDATPKCFLEGFRRLGSLLALFLLQTALYVLIAMAAMQVASTLVMFTPFGIPLLQIMQTLSADAAFLQTGTVPQSMMEQLITAAIPMYVAMVLLFAVLAVPVSYRLRLAQYAVLDDAPLGGLKAMLASSRYMKGNCLAFFKLDLSFWWYWLLQLLLGMVAYGDVLLPLLGISLPFGADVAMFVFYGLHMAGALALAWACRSSVETTYACAYDALRTEN